MPEGEETAPPGVRVMAVVRWLFVATMAGAASLSVLYYLNVFKPSGANAAGAVYYCPMHPAVVQDSPGECPICGMNLVLRDKAGAEREDSPRRHGVTKEADEAKRAGADGGLPPGHEGHRHNPSDPYFCPMEPEETALNATDRCPVCNMKLKARVVDGGVAVTDTSASMTTTTKGEKPTPGLQPVDISADRVQLMGIRTARAVRETHTPSLKAVATIVASERGVSRVHTRVSGWIERVDALETGRHVARGQVLAAIYSPEVYAAAVDHLNAVKWGKEEEKEKKGFTTETLRHGDGNTGKNLAGATRKRLALLGVGADEVAAIEKSGEAARQIKVRAPAGGTITRKGAVLGLYVQPGTELFEIVDLSTVWAIAEVLETDAAKIRRGQPAQIRFAAYPGEVFAGKVDFIYPALAAEARALRVRVVLANKTGKLRPGLYGDIALDLPPETGVFVPIEAVVDSGDTQVVFLSRAGGRFEPRRITQGRRIGDRVLVKTGLADGDVVVTTGNFLLDSESRLRTALEGMK
jgi:RND family efflux transporter MFP subunit